MKKVYVIDPLSPWGHADINEVIIDILRKDYQVYYCGAKGLVDEKYGNVTYYNVNKERFCITKNRLMNRIRLISALKEMLEKIDDICPDYIFVVSYEIITFFIASLLYGNKYSSYWEKTYILNHNNVDEMERSHLKAFLFRHLNSRITPVFYEAFISEYVNNKYRKNGFVIHHNINSYKLKLGKEEAVNRNISSFFSDKNNTYIVSPSSNPMDVAVIEEIMKLDREGVLKKDHVKFFIKDRTREYHSEMLYFYNGYLNDAEYNYIFGSATYILLLYNAQIYKYRVSGVYFDALTFLKPIIYEPNLFFQDQAKRFNRIGIEYNESMKKVICSLEPLSYQNECNNIEKAHEFYSDQHILAEFKEVFL